MSSIFDRLCSDQLIKDYPSHMKNNVHYECVTGSVAYGVSDDMSDMDVYGFCIPPKHILFPYSYGNIVGFGKAPENFEQFQKHHIIDKNHRKEYDVSIYNIVKFFQLCMENNPNMVDSLFVPTRCVLHSTQVGNHVRDNRKLFLSKKAYHKFKGYAFSQLSKMKNKKSKEFVEVCLELGWDYNNVQYEEVKTHPKMNPVIAQLFKDVDRNGRTNRLDRIAQYGMDTKFAYHVIRLLDETQQILEEGDLDLTRSREHLKAIRQGEWSLDNITDYFDSKIIILEKLYSTSSLRYSPDEEAIKNLLLECLEMHYGNIDNLVVNDKLQDKYVLEAYEALTKAINCIK